MTVLRILTVDDEPLALLRLEQALRRIPDVAHVGAAASCREALDSIHSLRPDVVLLDISMRDGSGFDVVDRLNGEAPPAIVFVTAFDHFAVRAFETKAVDYVLKPVSSQRLGEAIGRARDRLESVDAANQLAELRLVVDELRRELRDGKAAVTRAELWIRGNVGGYVRIFSDEIEWVKAEDDYVRLHVGDKSYLMRSSLRALAPKIDADRQFVRVHRAALVRKSAIRAVHRLPIGRLEVELQSGQRIPTGRVYARQLKAVIGSTPA
ncbi:LytTR family DNA-binding domain-containing protein [Sphingosinicella sp. CPCC 101087]|uniref:LytR/AlgR family response regulator transcription factor n=1 Tax=Sphingosinicella sp. CPCC 101087 TaxID=2497754 RepID=UPI00101CCC0E|nr:LytTR family DNA-binding domain-containing protein [Sphingosinicella sp. CPCC 101087]